MGVLTVGLLGFALLIPIGRLSIVEAGKSDRAGACGRAGLREVKVRRMLDYSYWFPVPTLVRDPKNPTNTNYLPPLCIDPLGAAKGMSDLVGGVVPRCTLIEKNLAVAERIFLWQDDKIFDLPSDPALRPARQFLHPSGGNSSPTMDANRFNADGTPATPASDANYSWLLTVVPSAAEATLPLGQKTRFCVSVAVCFQRNYLLGGEQQRIVTPGAGTDSVLLDSPVENLKANQWIMLCATNGADPPTVWGLQWYRVVSASVNPDGTQWLTLAGPELDVANFPNPRAVIIDSVIGVYSTTIDVERDPVWMK
jgi:hypothetical protein